MTGCPAPDGVSSPSSSPPSTTGQGGWLYLVLWAWGGGFLHSPLCQCRAGRGFVRLPGPREELFPLLTPSLLPPSSPHGAGKRCSPGARQPHRAPFSKGRGKRSRNPLQNCTEHPTPQGEQKGDESPPPQNKALAWPR